MPGGFMNVVLIILLFIAIAVVAIQSGRARRKAAKLNEQFLQEEDEANSVRKQPLDEELFYYADLSILPPLPDGDPFKVERASKRKMVRFLEPVTNLQLKKRYGRVQLELLAQYEENYSEYLRSLTKWAEDLIKKDDKNNALRILEHAIALGSEFRKTYKYAADIYAEKRNTENLEALLSDNIFQQFRDPATAKYITEYIHEKIVATQDSEAPA